MKKYIAFGVILILLTVILASCAETEKKSRKRIFEISSSDYLDPESCALCHQEIYKQWIGSMHNNAVKDEYFFLEHLEAHEDTEGFTDDFCIACHSPIGFVSGETKPASGSRLSKIGKKGVQCDFCHTVPSSHGIGNSQFDPLPGINKYGPYKDSISPFHGSIFSEFITTAEFCGMCHDVNHPVNKLPIEATYTEWKNGPYAKEGIQCQDCHMTPGPGVNKPISGKAARQGPKRENVYTHYFVGGNTFFSQLYGSPVHARKAEERLKYAASVRIFTKNSSNTFEVQVTNKGCGHYLPTGLTQAREMWLEVSVTDARNIQIYKSGFLDKDGNLDLEGVNYRTLIADKNGKETFKVWLAEKTTYDKRIPPRETSVEQFKFEPPADAVPPFIIQASLKYRSAPQYVIDKLFGKGNLVVPVVEMARATAKIP